ncbi:hypothetical protein BHM03_00033448 [Ensete ventricosum]|nr:hypothetical protein BHM03_00033448 [Ensete ventricosum]
MGRITCLVSQPLSTSGLSRPHRPVGEGSHYYPYHSPSLGRRLPRDLTKVRGRVLWMRSCSVGVICMPTLSCVILAISQTESPWARLRTRLEMFETKSPWERLRARLEMFGTKSPWARLRAHLDMFGTESPWVRLRARLEMFKTESPWTRLRARLEMFGQSRALRNLLSGEEIFLGIDVDSSSHQTLGKVTRSLHSISSGAEHKAS